MNILNDLSWLGKYVGSRLDLVQAGGGNISIKDDNILYIKSSGCVLSEINKDFGYSLVDRKKLNPYLDNLSDIEESKFGTMLEEVVDGDFKRPSIETPLHAIMDNKVVVHVHPIVCLALVSETNGKAITQELFPESCWIPYYTPGKKLAINFKDEYTKNKSKIIFLENHGVVVGADNVEEAINLLEKTIETIETRYDFDFENEKKMSHIQKIYKKGLNLNKTFLRITDREFIESFKKCNKTYKAICPDDVVYIGPEILVRDDLSEKDIIGFYEEFGSGPIVIHTNDITYIASENIIKCRQIFEQLYSNIVARSRLSSPKLISEKEVNFLSNWEAEKYRQKIKG